MSAYLPPGSDSYPHGHDDIYTLTFTRKMIRA
jgi:hypothetical protein